MKTKTHGWVRKTNNTNLFVMENCDESNEIAEAYVYSTRKEARESDDPIFRMKEDIVRKVEVDKNNKAVKIIPGR